MKSNRLCDLDFFHVQKSHVYDNFLSFFTNNYTIILQKFIIFEVVLRNNSNIYSIHVISRLIKNISLSSNIHIFVRFRLRYYLHTETEIKALRRYSIGWISVKEKIWGYRGRERCEQANDSFLQFFQRNRGPKFIEDSFLPAPFISTAKQITAADSCLMIAIPSCNSVILLNRNGRLPFSNLPSTVSRTRLIVRIGGSNPPLLASRLLLNETARRSIHGKCKFRAAWKKLCCCNFVQWAFISDIQAVKSL